MKFGPRGRTASLRAGAVFTLLAACVFAPSTASATCGDYVTTRAQREAHGRWPGGHEMMPDGAAGPGGGLTPGRRPPGDGLPCSGPSCSRRPAVPDAPAVPISVRTETWCDTSWMPRLAVPLRVAGLIDTPLLWPPRRASDLFRPPCPSRA